MKKNIETYGKVPPHSVEIEKDVLGSCLLEADAFEKASEYIKAESFYKEDHQTIFQAIKNLKQKGGSVDIRTVVEEIKKMGELENVGGAYYVTSLTNNVVSSAYVVQHSKILAEKFIKRELIRLGNELMYKGYDDTTDVFDIMEEHDKEYTQVSLSSSGSSVKTIDVLLVEGIKEIEHLRKQGSDITGVPSGFGNLDKITHGWQNTDLIILAARPSVGKTAFALNIALNASKLRIGNKKPTPTAFFSLEMSAGQLVKRLMSMESGIFLDKITTGRLEDVQMKNLFTMAVQPLAGVPFFIDDSGSLNIHQLRAKARRLRAKFGIGLIVIDYLQLMSGTRDQRGANREQEISNISRNLKSLAKELNIPIIALSQLSRDLEKRSGEKGKIPQLSDLRESGAIEQDADMVMFLYRPEYHDIVSDEHGESTKGTAELKIAKHRNGVLDTLKFRSRLEVQRFEEMNGDSPKPMNGFRPISMSRENDIQF